MYSLVLIFFALVFLVIATTTDLKSREIPNWLIVFFLVFGFAFKLIFGLVSKQPNLIYALLLSLAVTFAVFFLLWEFGVIAGGDLKLFLVLAVLTPDIALPFGLPVFLFSVFVFVVALFMSLPWLLIYSMYFIIKNNLYMAPIQGMLKRKSLLSLLNSVLVVFLLSLVFLLFGAVTPVIVFVFAFVFSFIVFKIRNKKVFYIVLLLAYAVVFYLLLSMSLFSLSIVYLLLEAILFVVVFSFLRSAYSSVKENMLVYEKQVTELEEGDLLVYSYYYDNNKLELVKPTFLNKIKRLLNNSYYPNLKVDSSKSCGLSKEEIDFLKGLYEHNLIDCKIYLRKTQAFAPAVLLGYILTIML